MLRTAALLLLTALLASLPVACNKLDGAQSAQTVAKAAPVPPLATPQQSATSTEGAEPADMQPPGNSGSSLAAADQHRLGVCKEYCPYCGKSLGENIAPPQDEPVTINVNFDGVSWNSADDANMSKLDFELVGIWKNRERMHTALSMDDRLQDSFPRVETGLCSLQVQPLLSETVETAIRQRGPEDYKTYGAYNVRVEDAKGALIGEFPLDGKGRPGEAQWQNTKQSVYHVGKSYKRDSDEWRFDIRRMAEFKEQKYDAPVLFGLVFRGEGTITQSAKGPDGSLHEYRFPAVSVDIYTPEAIRAAERSAFEHAQKERVVEYAHGEQPDVPLDPIFVSTRPQLPACSSGT